MKVICCNKKCRKEYSFEGSLYKSDKTNRPILVCPHCRCKHLLEFIPFEQDLRLKNIRELNLGPPAYVDLTATRIANDQRADQSGADDGDVTGWDKTADFILAIQIGTSKGVPDRRYKLRWRDVTDEGAFADVGAAGEISYNAATVLVDGATLGSGNKLCTGTPGEKKRVILQTNWQDGMESEGDNELPDSPGLYSLADEYYSEFQWALDCNSAQTGHEYEFELYEITNGVSIGTCLATITMEGYKVEGITKDKNGNVLGSCLCFLCKDNQDNSCSYIAYVLSDSVTGVYSFTGLSDNDLQYFVISWKDNTPHVFDVTDHVLQPVEP